MGLFSEVPNGAGAGHGRRSIKEIIMSRKKIYFAVFSIVFLVIMAFSPVKDFFREWKGYQHKYNKIINDLPQKVSPVDVGIKQIWIKKLDKIDRCETCHLGIKEDALKDREQPFRTHPHIYHDLEDYGCTICHEGQGPATTTLESTGKIKYWDKPLLPKEYMEASCGKCHKEMVVSQAPILTMGRKLIEESNCVACHKIEGFKKVWTPSLDGIGSKVNKTWLYNWLKDPKKYFSKTKMPNFLLSDEDAKILTEFLFSFKSFSGDNKLDLLPVQLTISDEKQQSSLVELGTIKFSEARCISCHSVKGKGGYAANDLGKIGSKVNEEWLYNYIKDPKRYQPDVIMPRYHFDEASLNAIVVYIESEYVDEKIKQISFNKPDTDYYAKGLALFEKYNCGSCHQLSGIKKNDVIGPELSLIGDKKLYEIEFGNSNIEQTLPNYIYTKIKNPRVFLESMKMPDFSFTDEEARSITVALLGYSDETIPEELKVKPLVSSNYNPQGDFGKLVSEYACFGCHTMNGRGRLIATDLTIEASKTQRGWLENYFKIPYSIRPILTERMPNLYLNDEEIKTIVEYMEKMLIVDSLERNVTMDDSKIEKGKGLFYEKFGCQSCHQVGSSGGYVGPVLDKVSQRLKPGWIYYWLKNPQSLIPGTIEPNYKMTDEEADAITAYLMALK